MDKIGVLLSVYKGDNPDYLKQSIASLLNQTHSNVFIYIGVDGRVGKEIASCLENYHKLENVQIVYFETNRGLAAVLNDLIQLCAQNEVEFMARMDADDISVPDRFEKQINFLKANEDVDIVGGSIEEIDSCSVKNGKKIIYPLTHDACRRFFRYRNPVAHPAVMFRKRFFEKTKGYRNECQKREDIMLWFDGFTNGCVFANLNETVLLFRVTPDFYKNRRGGYHKAKKILKDRFTINKMLHYDLSAYLFSFFMFVFWVLMPPFFKKWLYRIR
jgi:glycosyltransferase involved in cell wall biosynthesis